VGCGEPVDTHVTKGDFIFTVAPRAPPQPGDSDMRCLRILATTLILLAGVAPAAFAHAHLVKSQPAKGATVRVAPGMLTLWFSEPLEPDFCTVEVVDDAGHRVDQGKATLDPADPKILHVALKPLTPGTYKAVWRVVSIDTHNTNGNFAFTFAP
jgi:hypothetical protein